MFSPEFDASLEQSQIERLQILSDLSLQSLDLGETVRRELIPTDIDDRLIFSDSLITNMLMFPEDLKNIMSMLDELEIIMAHSAGDSITKMQVVLSFHNGWQATLESGLDDEGTIAFKGTLLDTETPDSGPRTIKASKGEIDRFLRSVIGTYDYGSAPIGSAMDPSVAEVYGEFAESFAGAVRTRELTYQLPLAEGCFTQVVCEYEQSEMRAVTLTESLKDDIVITEDELHYRSEQLETGVSYEAAGFSIEQAHVSNGERLNEPHISSEMIAHILSTVEATARSISHKEIPDAEINDTKYSLPDTNLVDGDSI